MHAQLGGRYLDHQQQVSTQLYHPGHRARIGVLVDAGPPPEQGDTAATVLLPLGVAERTVMGVMGWSNAAMAARHQHLTATIRCDIAQRVGGLLWEPTGNASPEPTDDDPAAGTAAQCNH